MEIDVYITRIELEIKGRRVKSELLRTDDDKRPYQTVVDRACTYECPSYHRCPYSHINEKADCQRVQKINKEFIEELDAYFGSF